MLSQDVYARDIGGAQAGARRFFDLVRLHASGKNILFLEQEMHLLQKGVTEFGLSLDETKGIVFNTAQSERLVLESQIDQHLSSFMKKSLKRGKISRREFRNLVKVYQIMTKDTVPADEAEKRVKSIVTRQGLHAKRDWLRLGSRRWFNKIKPPQSV